ncbi:GIY-YIG nuclease family protein [Patescibacteria group bacterium]|nr:GIY-YIG nuclease family protein [Patescibacteria group bacterium]
MYFVYFLRNKKTGKVYTGYTSRDPKIREKEHKRNKNRWTKNNEVVDLIYYESYVCKSDAIHREKFYKTGVGRKIKSLIVKR